MNRDEAVGILSRHRAELGRRFGVKRVALFGSTARDDAREDSDVDVLVEFDDAPTLRSFFGLEEFLEQMLKCKVDLATPASLHPRIRQRVSEESIDVA